jgi:hypothetical protein
MTCRYRSARSPRVRGYCRKPTKIRGSSAPPAAKLAATRMLPSALMPPMCTLPFVWVSVSAPLGVTV